MATAFFCRNSLNITLVTRCGPRAGEVPLLYSCGCRAPSRNSPSSSSRPCACIFSTCFHDYHRSCSLEICASCTPSQAQQVVEL